MRTVHGGFVNLGPLVKIIDKTILKLGKDVVRVRYSFDEDSTGEPSIYFRIVLTDAATRDENLRKSANRVEKVLEDAIRPRENWGLNAYFNFRSNSEQVALKDKDKAWV